MTSIIIPGRTSIAKTAFYGCSGIIQKENGVSYVDEWVIDVDDVSQVQLRSNTVGIADFAFSGCRGLTSITIPDSVTSIGSYAFLGCYGLKSITIPFVDGHFGDIFGGNSDDVPSSLKEVVITGGTSIGDRAFRNCSNLTSITIPDSVTSIGEDAFSDCSGLTSIIIPNSVTSIGDCAFYNCSGLTSITIPNSVTSIICSAFSGCENLKNIIFTGTRSQWDKIGYETEIPVICTGDTSTVSKTFDGGTSTGSMI